MAKGIGTKGSLKPTEIFHRKSRMIATHVHRLVVLLLILITPAKGRSDTLPVGEETGWKMVKFSNQVFLIAVCSQMGHTSRATHKTGVSINWSLSNRQHSVVVEHGDNGARFETWPCHLGAEWP